MNNVGSKTLFKPVANIISCSMLCVFLLCTVYQRPPSQSYKRSKIIPSTSVEGFSRSRSERRRLVLLYPPVDDDDKDEDDDESDDKLTKPPSIKGEKVPITNTENNRLGMGGLKALEKVNTLIKQSDG